MNEALTIFSTLGAGVALFLYGMKSMSNALQNAAGDKMKKILEKVTGNPILGVLTGILVTSVLQSSSAVTVMVIGFVAAGLMSLPAAIAVMFGSNIGTTMTAQLMAFKISNYIYPIIFIGFMMTILSKKKQTREIGMVIFSFGLLFEGMEIMSGAMKPLVGSPFFAELMEKVAAVPVLGVLCGAFMTLLVQSSSATIAILQNVASTAGATGASVLGLSGAIPILLGDNIGTTITAILAAMSQSKDAKRVALAHVIFNVSGTLVVLCILPVFTMAVQMISPAGNELDIIARQIANAHTLFNTANCLLWLPFIGLLTKLVTKVIPGATALGETRFLSQPVESAQEALNLVKEEILYYSKNVRALLIQIQSIYMMKENDYLQSNLPKTAQDLKVRSQIIADYIAEMFSAMQLTDWQQKEAIHMLQSLHCLEKIAAQTEIILDETLTSSGKRKAFSENGTRDVLEVVKSLVHLYNSAITAFDCMDKESEFEVELQSSKLKATCQRTFQAHLIRMQKKECPKNLTASYTKILSSIEQSVHACSGLVKSEEELDAPASSNALLPA